MRDQPIKIAAPDQGIAAIKDITRQYKGTSAANQCERLLAALRIRSLTTFEAMRVLDIYHPPARIRQLRKQGHNILTLWQVVFTESNVPHRVGLYVLQGEATNG